MEDPAFLDRIQERAPPATGNSVKFERCGG
jgi:hypothetical protein